MTERMTEEMLERAWNNSIEYSRQHYSHCVKFDDCYVWLLDSPRVLMTLTPSQHDEMLRDYGDDPDYRFIKHVLHKDDLDAVIDEIVQSV